MGNVSTIGAVLFKEYNIFYGLNELEITSRISMQGTNYIYYMSLVMRKPDFCICENKDADQLRGDREADQRPCFRYIDSTISLLPKYEISNL